MRHPSTHVALSVDVGSDPISGEVTVAAGPSAPFQGWIELAAAIEAARVSLASGPAPAAGQSPGGSPGARPLEI